jgi:hypothetical protein
MPRRKQRRAGRPCGLTVNTALKIGCAIGDSQKIEAAAQQAGVGTSTLYAWLARGRAGDPCFTTLAEFVAQKRKPSDWESLFRAYDHKSVVDE